MFKDLFLRNLEADDYQENFLVAAVVAILAIRVYLKLAGYPQIGGGGLHIAHMLWGGLLMLLALMLLISFLSRNAVNMAAILGGLGFGTFIDELGKFLTRDNNYFFQPTFALIYIIFVVLFLFSRFLPKYKKISKKEYLVNALDMIKEAVVNDLDIEEEKKAIAYLKKSDPDDPIVRSLIALMAEIESTPKDKPGIIGRVRQYLRREYGRLTTWQPVMKLVTTVLVIQMLVTMGFSGYVFTMHPAIAFHEWGEMISALGASVFVLAGVWYMRISKYRTYRYFRISILITIFLTEFFAFYETPLLAICGLLLNVFFLAIVNYVIQLEKTHPLEKKSA